MNTWFNEKKYVGHGHTSCRYNWIGLIDNINSS